MVTRLKLLVSVTILDHDAGAYFLGAAAGVWVSVGVGTSYYSGRVRWKLSRFHELWYHRCICLILDVLSLS